MKERTGDITGILLPLILALYLILGLAVYDDYGAHWDEMKNQEYSRYIVGYVKSAYNEGLWAEYDGKVQKHHKQEHGPIFEFFLGMGTGILDYSDQRDIILFRHLANFLLFFASAVLFARLLDASPHDRVPAAAGLLIYILHPRIFAHAFFNTTDISLLAFFTASFYTADRFFRKPCKKTIFFHAIATSLAINVRLAGLIIVASTALIAGIRAVLDRRGDGVRKTISPLFAYLILTGLITFITWPMLWTDSGLFLASYTDTINQYGTPSEWYYNLRYFSITTPVMTSALFLAGLAVFASSVPAMRAKFKSGDVMGFFAITILFLSLALPVYYRTYLYDFWRHHFFIYSSVAYICFLGVSGMRGALVGAGRRIAWAFAALAILSYIPSLAFMVAHHPNQQVYASMLASDGMEELKMNGGMDYFGLSYRTGIEHLLDTREGELKIKFHRWPGALNVKLLEKADRDRIRSVSRGEADYFITNHRNFDEERFFKKRGYAEVFSIEQGGVKYMSVYEMYD